MQFIIGFIIGLLFSVYVNWKLDYNRSKIERKTIKDVRNLMEHFACGQGYVGCPGGLKCSSDHK